jgi:two-component system sensor kinase FixL
VRSDASDRGIGIRLEVAADISTVTGDRVQLQQVVLNLLRNAVEAIVQRPGLIEVRISPVADGVRLAVSDSGSGIPPELLDQIFSPFFSTKDSGLGMGLSISRTIIETHGGRLWAEANPSAGATFAFTLPYRNHGSRGCPSV